MRKTLARCAWTVAVTVAIGGLSTAHAGPVGPADVYGNLGTVNTTTTQSGVGFLGGGQENQYQAQGFSVGPQVGNSAWKILEIDLGLFTPGFSSPVVQIWSDSAGAPGSALATYTTSSPVDAKAIYAFTGSFIAQQNTSYWVVLSNANAATSGGNYAWYINDEHTTPTELLASGINYLGTKESNNLEGWTNNVLSDLSIALYATATAVPEIDPSSFGSALALLAGSLGLLERRARRLLGLMA